MWRAVIVLVFVVALAAKPMHGEAWFWETGNAFGFLAFALLLVLLGNGRGKLGRSQLHRWLGIGVVLAVVLHSLWFLIGDPVTWEYLKWGAPHYMVAGLFSGGLVLLLTLTSLTSLRNRSYRGYKPFRLWHQWLSIAIIVTAFLHVVFSGFYIERYWQAGLLLLLSMAAYFVPTWLKLNVSFDR